MEKTEKEWVEEIRENAGKLASYLDKDLVNNLLLIYAIENDDKEEIKAEIESLMNNFSNQLLFSRKPLLECPNRSEAQGEIKIGKVIQGENELWNFGLTREEINQHILIVARSGAGKTTLIMQIMKQLISKHIPFIVLDFKQDYRHLIRHYPQLVVLNWKDLRINPLEPPPGVSFQEWKQQFLNIFGHVQGIWHGSTQYLLEAIDEAYEEKKSIPTMEDVYKKIHESSESTRKLQEYASVVETRLYGLLSKLGKVINSKRTLLDMERSLQLPVILELHGLGRDEANIITLWFFYWIYAYRRAHGIRGRLLHVLIIDEAKRVFTGSEQYSQTTAEYSGIPPADLVCDEIRDFGEAIIASDQEPTKLSNSLKANTYTKITGFLGNGKDINDIAEAMDLSEEEREAITKLERGEWLVKLAGRYTKPFIIKSEDFPLKKDVTDEELKEKMKPIMQRLMKTEIEEKQASPTIRVKDEQEFTLTRDAWDLLNNINTHPFSGIVGRKKLLDISAWKLEKAKKELITKGLVVQKEIQLTGRPTAFLILTNKALQFLDSKGIDTRKWRYIGHVGYEHMLYQVLIRSGFEKIGYDAHLEVEVSRDRRIDVLAVKGKWRIGIEVELSANVDLRHKLEGIESLHALYIVTRKDMFYQIRDKLGDLPEKVRVYSIDVLLNKLRKLIAEHKRINSFKQNKHESKPVKQNNPRIYANSLKEEK